MCNFIDRCKNMRGNLWMKRLYHKFTFCNTTALCAKWFIQLSTRHFLWRYVMTHIKILSCEVVSSLASSVSTRISNPAHACINNEPKVRRRSCRVMMKSRCTSRDGECGRVSRGVIETGVNEIRQRRAAPTEVQENVDSTSVCERSSERTSWPLAASGRQNFRMKMKYYQWSKENKRLHCTVAFKFRFYVGYATFRFLLFRR